jgi:outer membrane protein assembly factor BamB
MADDKLRALNCPNCGAPISFPEDQNTVRCAFCGSIIDRSDDAPTADDEGHALKINFADGRVTVERPQGRSSAAKHFTIKMQGGQPMVIEDWETGEPAVVQTTRTYRPAAGRKSGAGCVVGFVILIIVLTTVVPIVVSVFGIQQITGIVRSIVSGDFGGALTAAPTLGTRFLVGDSGILTPSLSDAPPDLIALATLYPPDAPEGEKRLVALGGAEPKLLWQSAALDKDTYTALILANRDFVYTVSGMRLFAFRRADGATAWEAPLADELQTNLCSNCLRLLEDRLFALTADGTLEAFDARTGQPAWRFRGNEASPRGLYLLDGRPAFADRDEEGSDGFVRVFDPATGEQETFRPECSYGASGADTVDWTTPLFPARNGSDLFIIFGFFEPCLQRWDGGALTQVWDTKFPDGNRPSDVPPLVADDDLYLTFGGQIVAVSTATGELRTLIEDEDYRLIPLAVHDDLLLVRAARTRGSLRYELWTLDKESGERRWKFDLGEDQPLDPPDANTSIISDEQSVWTWHSLDGELMILRFNRAADDVSHAILIDSLDWQTGTSRGQTRVPLGVETIILSAPTIFGWTGDTAWMSIENQMLGFDAASEQIIYQWP